VSILGAVGTAGAAGEATGSGSEGGGGGKGGGDVTKGGLGEEDGDGCHLTNAGTLQRHGRAPPTGKYGEKVRCRHPEGQLAAWRRTRGCSPWGIAKQGRFEAAEVVERRKNRHQGISSKAGPASIGTPCSTRAKKQRSCGDQCHGSRSKRGERANHENLQSTGKKSRFSRGAHMEESDTCRVQPAAAAAANDPPKPNCFRQTLDPAPLEGFPRRKPLPSPSLGPLKSEISGHGSALA